MLMTGHKVGSSSSAALYEDRAFLVRLSLTPIIFSLWTIVIKMSIRYYVLDQRSMDSQEVRGDGLGIRGRH